jgi:very-short-patch-repair endonuclease
MAREVTNAERDNAIELYLSGKSSKQVQAATGVSASMVIRELHRRGIEPRTGRLPIEPSEVAQAYLAGEAEWSIAKRLGVSRPLITRRLKEAGVTRRTLSEITTMQMAGLSEDERRAQVAGANRAARGRKASIDERMKRASTKEVAPAPPSPHEAVLAELLTSRGVRFTREKAEGIYNIDFAVGPVAVEVLGGNWHAAKTRHRTRTPYILNAGWAMLFVWSPMLDGAADYVVAFAEQVGRDPSRIGEYRVIAGGGELLATGRCDGDDFPGIPTPKGDLRRR